MQLLMGVSTSSHKPFKYFPSLPGHFPSSSHVLLNLTKVNESKGNLLERDNNEPLEIVNVNSWPHLVNVLSHAQKNQVLIMIYSCAKGSKDLIIPK